MQAQALHREEGPARHVIGGEKENGVAVESPRFNETREARAACFLNGSELPQRIVRLQRDNLYGDASGAERRRGVAHRLRQDELDDLADTRRLARRHEIGNSRIEVEAHKADSPGERLRQMRNRRVRDALLRQMAENRRTVVEYNRQIDRTGKRGVEQRKVVGAIGGAVLHAGAGEEVASLVEADAQRFAEDRLEVARIALRADEGNMSQPLLQAQAEHDSADARAGDEKPFGGELPHGGAGHDLAHAKRTGKFVVWRQHVAMRPVAANDALAEAVGNLTDKRPRVVAVNPEWNFLFHFR